MSTKYVLLSTILVLGFSACSSPDQSTPSEAKPAPVDDTDQPKDTGEKKPEQTHQTNPTPENDKGPIARTPLDAGEMLLFDPADYCKVDVLAKNWLNGCHKIPGERGAVEFSPGKVSPSNLAFVTDSLQFDSYVSYRTVCTVLSSLHPSLLIKDEVHPMVEKSGRLRQRLSFGEVIQEKYRFSLEPGMDNTFVAGECKITVTENVTVPDTGLMKIYVESIVAKAKLGPVHKGDVSALRDFMSSEVTRLQSLGAKFDQQTTTVRNLLTELEQVK